jgi:hypothetical protein
MSVAMTVSTSEAAAVTKEACIDAHASSQVLQRKGQLRAAREQLEICLQETCPQILRVACGQWLEQVEASTPTVVFEAKDGRGEPTADVRVLMDGAPLADHLDGRSIPLDPGEHTFRFDAPDGAHREMRILVPEGRKNWPIVADFVQSKRADVGATSATGAAGADGSRRTLGYVLGGVGLASIATGAAFGIVALGASKQNVCSSPCPAKDANGAPNPTLVRGNDAYDRAGTFAWLSDIGFGAGILALGVGAYLVLTSAAPNAVAPQKASVSVLPTVLVNGGALLFEGRL